MVAKTSPFGLKNRHWPCAAFLVERSVTVFLPLKMSYVAEQHGVMSWLVRGACSQAQRHDSGT